jgi:hypothetical protein
LLLLGRGVRNEQGKPAPINAGPSPRGIQVLKQEKSGNHKLFPPYITSFFLAQQAEMNDNDEKISRCL